MKVRRLRSAMWLGAPLFPEIRGIKQEIVEPKKVVCEDSSKETVTSPLYLGSGLKYDMHLSACDYNASVRELRWERREEEGERTAANECTTVHCRCEPVAIVLAGQSRTQECERANAIWKRLLSMAEYQRLSRLQFTEWVDINLKGNVCSTFDGDWRPVFNLRSGDGGSGDGLAVEMDAGLDRQSRSPLSLVVEPERMSVYCSTCGRYGPVVTLDCRFAVDDEGRRRPGVVVEPLVEEGAEGNEGGCG
nr:hypothetical protein Iba_chr11cCG10920 [Ipomoea batatas]